MTLLHQAAQKAVEAKQREAFEHWYSDAGRWPKSVARGDDGHYLLAQANSSYEAWRAAVSALQHQEVPSDKQIARAFADEQMRQGSGTHNRHEWFRRGALWAASPSTTRQQEVGSKKPLTLAQIIDATEHIDMARPGVFVTVARAIERAHGIGRAAAPSTPEKAGGVSDGVGGNAGLPATRAAQPSGDSDA